MGLGLSIKGLASGIGESLGFSGHDNIGSLVGTWMNNFNGTSSAANLQYKNQSSLDSANRRWQESMSNSAYQRQVADMRSAGVNPILGVMSSNGASTPTGGVGNASAGVGGDLLGTIVNSAKAKRMLNLQQAQQKADIMNSTRDSVAYSDMAKAQSEYYRALRDATANNSKQIEIMNDRLGLELDRDRPNLVQDRDYNRTGSHELMRGATRFVEDIPFISVVKNLLTSGLSSAKSIIESQVFNGRTGELEKISRTRRIKK